MPRNHAIVYVTDRAFLPPTLSSARSFERKGVDADIFIFLTEDNELEQSKQWLYEQDSKIQIDFRKMASVSRFQTLPHISSTTYGRLFLDTWLSPHYERVLYLDGDTIHGPKPLDFLVPLNGKVFGAVVDLGDLLERIQDKYPQASSDNLDRSRYFNAGVLLFDWGKWCSGEYSKKTLELLAKQPDLPLGDQDALNLVCQDDVCLLPVEWNCQTPILHDIKTIQGSHILHYTGGIKPWQLDRWPHKSQHGYAFKPFMLSMPFHTSYKHSTLRAKFKRFLKPIEAYFKRGSRQKLSSIDIPYDLSNEKKFEK